jgi:glycosyltransferase involved in cell wall biosynthesis
MAGRNNIRFLDQPNSGVSSARNAGIEIAQGEYLLFVDGDDTIQTGILPKVDQFIHGNNLDLVHFNIINDSEVADYKNAKEFELNGDCMPGPEYYLKYRRNGNARDTACTTFFRRELLEKYSIRFNEKAKYLEDGEFLAKAYSVAERCQGSFYPLYIRTQRPDSVTRSNIHKRKNTIDGVSSSAISLKKFKDQYVMDAEGIKAINQALIKFVTLTLLLCIRRFDLVSFIRYFNMFQRNGLRQLNYDGATMNFPELAKAYNHGWLPMLIYSIVHTGPFVRYKKRSVQKLAK